MPLNDTWEWDGSAWTQLFPAASPSARQAAAIVYDPIDGTSLLFGGFSETDGPAPDIWLSDTWLWNGATWTQLFPPINAQPPDDFVMGYDVARANVVMFGNGFADTWLWQPLPSGSTDGGPPDAGP